MQEQLEREEMEQALAEARAEDDKAASALEEAVADESSTA